MNLMVCVLHPAPLSISCQSDPRRTPTPLICRMVPSHPLRSVLLKRCLRLWCLRPHNLCLCLLAHFVAYNCLRAIGLVCLVVQVIAMESIAV